MKILVTGGSGFIGSHLIPALKKHGHSVDSFEGDIREISVLRDFVSGKNFDCAVHLAGIAHPVTCENDPKVAHEVNVGGTVNLLEVLREQKNRVRLVFPSSARIYAAEKSKKSLTEESKIEPHGVYGQNKWEGELLLKDGPTRGPVDAVILRLFNHTHKTQSPDFFLPGVYKALSSKPKGSTVKVRVGNVDIDRDIGSLQDLVASFVAVVESKDLSPHEVFNVSSGTTKNLRGLVQELAHQLGVEVDMQVDPARVRSNEAAYLCGSSEKLRAKTGWQSHCETPADLIREFLREI